MGLDFDTLYAIVTNSPHYVIVLNTELEIEFINRAGPTLSIDELMGRSVESFLAPAARAATTALLREVIETGETKSFAVDVELSDTLHQYDNIAVPLYVDGKVRGITLHAQDTTTRKIVEEQRDALQALMEKAETVAHFGSFEIQRSAQGERLNLSKELLRILGVPPALFGPRTPVDLEQYIHPDDRQRVQSAVARAIQDGTAMEIDYRVHRVDGPTRWVRSKTEATVDEEGRPTGLIGILRDITEERQSENQRGFLDMQLRQAQKMEAVGTLASGVAHDFNNLLMGVMGCASLALEVLPDKDPARHYLNEILRTVETGAAVTRQLLTFTHKREAAVEVFDINATIAEQQTMLSRLLGEDIEFELTLQKGACWVQLDPIQVEQVLMNLAVNARYAMPRGGRLRIATTTLDASSQHPGSSLQGPLVQLEVSDTGIGMSEETRERVFEPFFTTKEVGEGTGLGLSTAYGIVQQAGGSIQVQSAPGSGATFQILLPLAQAPTKRPGAERVTAPMDGNMHATVLLVEDEPLVRMTTTHYLKQAGYEVMEASDGEEALRIFKEFADEIDVVVTDVVLPKLNGPLLVDAIRSLKNVKVLLMSAHSADWLKEKWHLGEGTQFIQKPFDNHALLSRLHEVMRSGNASAPSG